MLYCLACGFSPVNGLSQNFNVTFYAKEFGRETGLNILSQKSQQSTDYIPFGSEMRCRLRRVTKVCGKMQCFAKSCYIYRPFCLLGFRAFLNIKTKSSPKLIREDAKIILLLI